MKLAHKAFRAALISTCLLFQFAATPAMADGLQISETPRWQARLQLGSIDSSMPGWTEGRRYSSSRLLSANLLGDYYLTGSGLENVRGGLRATGGMLMGPLSLSGSGLALGTSSFQLGQTLAIGRRNLLTPGLDANDPNASMSYLGIGYSGQSLHGGWGFSADLGLLNKASVGGLRLGNSNMSGMEDVLRDMRYKPVLQLGLSYSY